MIRTDWTLAEVDEVYNSPFMELLYQAHTVHLAHFPKNAVQISTLLSVKTGACPEDCGYCSQSGHFKTGLVKEKLLPLATVRERALQAKENGATRFCMGAAWRHLPDAAMPEIIAMIQEVKALGLETCVTAGMLTATQCTSLKEAGLEFYNHNLDTSPEYYPKVTTTRTYQDRLETIQRVRDAGIHVCCGGIMGLGESQQDRISFLRQLAITDPHPESVPINQLMRVAGTPLADSPALDPFEFVRTIATARILMPTSRVRLSAGRENMSDELQAWCFFAGANSIFVGEKLLTTPNPAFDKDQALLSRLNIQALQASGAACEIS